LFEIVKKISDEIISTMNKKVEVRGTTVPKNWVGLAVFVVILIIMSMVFADAADQDTIDPMAGAGGFLVQKNLVFTGYTEQGNANSDTRTINITNQNIIYANFTLTWRDEPDKQGRQNQPDSFRLNVTTPRGNSSQDTGQNPREQEGEIFLSFKNPSTEKYNSNETGDYVVVITCTNAGPQSIVGPIPAEPNPDDGNHWTLKVDYIYRVKGGNSVKRFEIPDYTDEGSATDFPFEVVHENIVSINFTLQWKDEEDAEGKTNYPDTFLLRVKTPWGETAQAEDSNPQGAKGSIPLAFENPSKKEQNKKATGEYMITVECTAAGDQEPVIVGVGEDEGNHWTLFIEYVYNVEYLDREVLPPPGAGGQT